MTKRFPQRLLYVQSPRRGPSKTVQIIRYAGIASRNSKIWKAARATTVVPTFFKRITIVDDGGAREDFLDGGLRFNNPAHLVLDEALAIFEGASKLGCLVSIGTSHPSIIDLSQPDAF